MYNCENNKSDTHFFVHSCIAALVSPAINMYRKRHEIGKESEGTGIDMKIAETYTHSHRR